MKRSKAAKKEMGTRGLEWYASMAYTDMLGKTNLHDMTIEAIFHNGFRAALAAPKIVRDTLIKERP